MTPKEKAKELIDKMSQFQYFASRQIAIQHALIAVDEIMEFPKTLLYTMNVYRFRTVEEMDIDGWSYEEPIIVDKITAFEYWQQVKLEIQSL